MPFPSDYLVDFFAPWDTEYEMAVKNNAMPDVITQIFPWKKLTIDTWKSGQIPLWNPYSFSGTPHAGNYQSAVFSPVNLLFFIFPFVDAWTLMILLQPIVAASGMYLFIRRLEKSREASLISAIAFMFCNFMVTWMAYGTLGWAIAFLPWALWAAVAGSGVVVSLAVAASFLSGHFQISVYVLGVVLAYILYVRKVRLLVYVLLGLFLASPQIFLTYDSYVASTRNVGIGKIEVIPWQYIITLFAPDFFGNPVTRNDWFGHYAEWGAFVGVVPLLLGLLSLVRKAKDGRVFFIFLSFTSVLFAYPTPVNDLLYRLNVPVFSTSASSRIIVLLSFAIASLSAFGFDDLKSPRKSLVRFVISCCIGIGVLWMFLITTQAFTEDQLTIARRNSILPTVIAVSSLFIMLLGMWRKKIVPQIIFASLFVLVALDSLRFAAKWMPMGSREHMYPQISSLTFLTSNIGYNRVFGNIGNEVASVFGVPLIEGYDALYQGRYAKFINSATTGLTTPGGRSVVQFDKHAKFKTNILKLLGIKYIYHRVSDGSNSWAFPYWEYVEDGTMQVVFNDEKYQIFEYTDAYPRAFLASAYKIETDEQHIINTLFAEEFDSRETVVLEEKPSFEPSVGEGSAEIVLYKPTSVTIQTTSDVPKLLFLSDVYDPGWHAFVDGEKTPVYRAHYDFRAVSVPAGVHAVEFYYFPKKLSYGFLLSFGALILLLYANRHLRSIS